MYPSFVKGQLAEQLEFSDEAIDRLENPEAWRGIK